jgi:hypothetical protein
MLLENRPCDWIGQLRLLLQVRAAALIVDDSSRKCEVGIREAAARDAGRKISDAIDFFPVTNPLSRAEQNHATGAE